MFDKEECRAVLEEFLRFPLYESVSVMEKFAALPGAYCGFAGGKKNFVFVPGARKDRIVLAAHADTVWDLCYGGSFSQEVVCENGVYGGTNPLCGIGADDRAGCAMLWLLRGSGHSLLVLDGEEHGQIGSHYLMDTYPQLFDLVNSHSCIIQLDRRNAGDFKTYNLPVSEAFVNFIRANTGYADAGRLSRTDIVVLCREICGVNLSVGYHSEHTAAETLVFEEWYHTLSLVESMISPPQEKYPLSV